MVKMWSPFFAGKCIRKEDNDSMAAESCIRLFNVDNIKHSGYLAQAGHLFRK